MAFLSLAQGDPVGRDLLKKMVVARYGSSPPAMDTLRVTFTGRSRGSVGPFRVWAKVEATATYRFPFNMRWDFKIRMLRFIRSTFSTSFDGEFVYEQRGIRVEKIDDEKEIQSARHRAWAETVFFISPLIANDQVRVEGIDSDSLRAVAPGGYGVEAVVRLHQDRTLAEIEVARYDSLTGTDRRQYMRPVGPLARVDNLILPQTIQRWWDDELFMELSPLSVERHPDLPEGYFSLAGEDISDILADIQADDSDSE